MATDEEIKGEKLQYDINRKTSKISPYHQARLINMNILRGKKYSLLAHICTDAFCNKCCIL